MILVLNIFRCQYGRAGEVARLSVSGEVGNCAPAGPEQTEK